MVHLDDAAHRLFGKPLEALGSAERRVLHKTKTRQPVSEDLNVSFEAQQSVGDRLADGIARVGGSWSFIIGFLLFLAVWAFANTVLLTKDAFDPYPFIFLNLVLSMVAAIQAPIIMMSQNRQASRDRLDAAKDYEVNLRSEIELISLHNKVDTILLAEIAKLQEEVARLHLRLDAEKTGGERL
ncbi:hypothetical protein BJF92_11725 [Rhizobium rhizosphaerae]|uniref:DUF1003 domain-containing protein n=1 Tax=Xaviernesmea rhizosphaerae TaxID=1672749 RepID=A0A1Q9AMW2_9HYPH|nr:DUF1003 domain-containing protein [Xaviernesmea rhizosphaerae]OLP56742.1 hypothetical protein BJF92_11725 [Xaviernesmea rhizosphaerae]OQP88308.1 hypothetical protein BTR14_02390 [Xaviernesmea rhizosphaerae]